MQYYFKNIFFYLLIIGYVLQFGGCNKKNEQTQKQLNDRKKNPEKEHFKKKQQHNPKISIDDLVQEYIQGMGDMQQAWWGGELELNAIAEILNCNIYVWQHTSNNSFEPIKFEISPKKQQTKTINIYYDGINHYQYFIEQTIQATTKPQPIAGDGHCIFRSALSAKEKKLINDNQKIADLRQKVAEYFQKNNMDGIKTLIEMVMHASDYTLANDAAKYFPSSFGQKLLNLYKQIKT